MATPAVICAPCVGPFPFPQMAQRMDTLFFAGGKKPDEPYKPSEKPALKNSRWFDELCIVSNFVEVFLAREATQSSRHQLS